jgi:formylglycine-generating enzyme required for sulfatase activity
MVMVYVPAGTFLMGTAEDDPLAQSDEIPQHSVTLSAFWIDRAEVSNAQFARCVEAGVCMTPFEPAMEVDGDYYGNPQYGDYPVVNVSWVQAQSYCEWAGGTLPSEAQWEYASRGPESPTYPWGEVPPDETLLNYGRNVGSTTEAGSYAASVSWCGALDLAGNVWEWVADWYGPYPPEAQTDPLGPEKGSCHVLRGGSWFDIGDFGRAANRYCLREAMRDYQGPVGHGFNVGFRCVVLP